jgi:hypothetical protein
MQLRGEKKEVIVTDIYQHTPNPQALQNDCSLHLGITHSHWLDERKRTGVGNGNKMLLESV